MVLRLVMASLTVSDLKVLHSLREICERVAVKVGDHICCLECIIKCTTYAGATSHVCIHILSCPDKNPHLLLASTPGDGTAISIKSN